MVTCPAVPPGTVALLSPATGVPAETRTVAVCVTATPAISALTTRSPGRVALRVPVVVPSLPVGPPGWVSVLPVPLTDRVTASPAIGFSNASRAVTVMVLALVPVEAEI